VIRRTLGALLAVAALVCAGGALRAGDEPDRAPTRAALATPMWSARRVPQPIVDAAGVPVLQRALDAELGATDGCVAVSSADGELLAARNPDAPQIPASTLKVLIGMAAIMVLGADFRYETTAVAPEGGVRAGSVERLWLVGAGDPLLATPEYAAALADDPFTAGSPTTPLVALADSIVAAGVREVPGGIVGDDSRYDRQRYLPTWPDNYRTEGTIGPIGALTVNDGFSSPRVPVADPARYAAEELTRLVTERGVAVGAPSQGTAPGGTAPVGSVVSPPLAEIVGAYERGSDNLTGEMLVRELGTRAGEGGTTAAGLAVVTATLAELGVPTEGLVLHDGSGLDRGNQVSCTHLLAAIGAVVTTPELAPVADGLAVAGATTGTLAGRLVGTPLDGRLRAKTGSLRGVTGLTGVVEVTQPVRFAFLGAGGFSEQGGAELRERVALVIGRYPEVPPADVLVPAPAPPG